MFATRSWVSGPFLLRALHERRDRCRNALIDKDHENLFLVAKKNGEAAAGGSYSTEVHFDNGLTHTGSLYFAFTPRSELLSAPLVSNDCFRSA
jgi:hypothetical protein